MCGADSRTRWQKNRNILQKLIFEEIHYKSNRCKQQNVTDLYHRKVVGRGIFPFRSGSSVQTALLIKGATSPNTSKLQFYVCLFNIFVSIVDNGPLLHADLSIIASSLIICTYTIPTCENDIVCSSIYTHCTAFQKTFTPVTLLFCLHNVRRQLLLILLGLVQLGEN